MLSWGWLFFINIPICIIIICLALRHLKLNEKPDREKDPTKLGGVSAMVLIGSMLLLMEDLGDPGLNFIGKILLGVLTAVSLYVLIYSIRKDAGK